MENVIEIRDLCKAVGGFCLQNVSLSLPCGTIMGLVGENGAGKTTLIRLMLGAMAPDSGEIRLLGKDVRREEEVKARIGVVTDECCFHDGLRPKDISRIFRAIYRDWDDGAFERYLRQFALPRERMVKEFSRGMKMKLSIAAALSHYPELLILDEATGGLDPIVRDEILDLLLEFIGTESHGVLISSHIVSDLEKAADYIAFLHRGQMLFCEEKDKLLERCGILRFGEEDIPRLSPEDRARVQKGRFGGSLLVQDREAAARRYPGFVIDRAGIEDVMLYTVKGEGK